jgi:hypothetical protein
MPKNIRTSISIGLEPLRTRCPRCDKRMRRDYTNHRTVFSPDRTIALTLQIVRCKNSQCSRFKRPYRPEVEWHYALPDTKFALDTSTVIVAAHLEGKSNLAIHRNIVGLGIPSSPRSIANILSRDKRLFTQRSPFSGQLISQLKAERMALLDILVEPDPGGGLRVLVHECFSNCVLAGARVSRAHADEELSALFHSIIDRLPVPVELILLSPSGIVRSAVTRMWPRTKVIEVMSDGLIGKRTDKWEQRRQGRPRRRSSRPSS